MTEDDLTRIRRADPVRSLPDPSRSPAARALVEEILMTDVDTTAPASPAAPPADRARPSRWRWAVAAAAAVVLASAAAGVVALGGDSEEKSPPVAQEPITPGGAASCVELYDLTTLANRQVAFDGTVKGVDGDRVTFTVHRWFRGGNSAEVTLDGATTLSGITSAGPAASLEPGTRLLVAGDGGFAWSCGFTQPYDAAVAAEWERALAG